MDALKPAGIEFEVIPGVSSFLASAAALKQEYTFAGHFTDGDHHPLEGRTPMPKKEQLSYLAAHQATMCIFVRADDGQRGRKFGARRLQH